MPKKTFKDNTAHLDRFFSDADRTQEERSTHGTHSTHEPSPPAPSVPPDPRFYRLNLKLKAEYREYLERVSWESHMSITQYLNDLIAADKHTRDI